MVKTGLHMSLAKKIAKKFGYENKYRFLMSVIFDIAILLLFTLILLALNECSCVTGIPYQQYVSCMSVLNQSNLTPNPVNLSLIYP